jgi:hypothetical protein
MRGREHSGGFERRPLSEQELAIAPLVGRYVVERCERG